MDRAYLIADLGYGDSGKGATVDYLCRRESVSAVARYNGGAQAGHTVVDGDRRHVFAMYGSGAFVGVPTVLTKGVIVNPINMFHERRGLRRVGVTVAGRTYVDRDCLIATSFHVALNRLREKARGDGRHGSCGQGIGETRAYDLRVPPLSLRVRDLSGLGLREKLHEIQLALRADAKEAELTLPLGWEMGWPLTQNFTAQVLEDSYLEWLTTVEVVDAADFLYSLPGTVVFEGAQGVLLDESYGFHPHTTWTDITYGNALEVIGEQDVETIRYGLLRPYATRHGAGPFPTEDKGMTVLDETNVTNDWQGSLRVGHFDFVTARYAIDVLGGIDGLCVSHLDHGPQLLYAEDYLSLDHGLVDRLAVPANRTEQEALTALMRRSGAYALWEFGERPEEEISERLGVPLAVIARGPSAADRSTVGMTTA